VRYWKLALIDCGPDDYVFSKGLRPGATPITAAQITRRWETHVKNAGIGITADFYAFKHANNTEMKDTVSDAAIAMLDSHKGTGMIRKIYDTKRISREHDEVRKSRNQY